MQSLQSSSVATESLQSQLGGVRAELTSEQSAHRASKEEHSSMAGQLRKEVQEAAGKMEGMAQQLRTREEVSVEGAEEELKMGSCAVVYF